MILTLIFVLNLSVFAKKNRFYKPFRPKARLNGEYLSLKHLGPPNKYHVINEFFGEILHQKSYIGGNLLIDEDTENPIIYPTDYGAGNYIVTSKLSENKTKNVKPLYVWHDLFRPIRG